MVVEIIIPQVFCSECGGSLMNIIERGDTVCSYCGLVIEEKKIDHAHSGIRAYTQNDRNKKERTGSPISILVPDISLSTVIERSKIKNPDLRRAAKWNTHLSWKKRNLLIAITELKRISANLDLPERVKKAAVKLYKEVFKKDLIRGRSIVGMMAACIYFSCKDENIPITFQELLDQASIPASLVKKCFKTIMRQLNKRIPALNPISLIPKFIADLSLDFKTESSTINLISGYMKKNSISGKDPKGFCAGAIYLIAKLRNIKVSQKDISKVVGVTEVTLRSRYKEILDSLSFAF